MQKPKILLWDLECSDLRANWGVLLCGGIKEYGKPKVTVHCTNTPTNDKEVCRALRDQLSDADAWVTWYGKRYDEPFLNSRLIFHGLKPLPRIPHIDGWRIAKYKLLLNSNRLQSVRDFLGLETDKTKVSGNVWMRAISGDKGAMRYIVDHCRKDVMVLEQAYDRIKPLITTESPNLAAMEGHRGCAICGAEAKLLTAHGYSFAQTRRYRRYQCGRCGGWTRGAGEALADAKGK